MVAGARPTGAGDDGRQARRRRRTSPPTRTWATRARTESWRRTSSRWRTAPGVVHVAPAFGPEDLELGRREGWPVYKPVDDEGTFTTQVPEFLHGRFVKDADPHIVEDLERRGLVIRAGRIEHSYPVLLAVPNTAAVLRTHVLVRRDDAREGAAARGQRVGPLVPRAHQARPLRRLAREQRRLGALARSLLGNAAAHLALLGRPCDRGRLAHGPVRARRPRRDGSSTRTARTSTRSPSSARRAASRPGGFPRSSTPGTTPARCRSRSGATTPTSAAARRTFEGALPRRLHLRGDRPDSRMVLHAHGRGRPCTSTEPRTARRLPRPHRRRGRQEDVEEPRQHARSLGGARSPGRGCAPLVPAHDRIAVVVEAHRSRDPRRGRSPLPAHALERVLVLRDVRERRGIRCRERAPAPAERPVLDRWILSQLAQTVRDARAGLDAYDATAAGRRIERFVDDLSNWYVRRARRRFWNAERRAGRRTRRRPSRRSPSAW